MVFLTQGEDLTFGYDVYNSRVADHNTTGKYLFYLLPVLKDVKEEKDRNRDLPRRRVYVVKGIGYGILRHLKETSGFRG